MQKKMKVGIFDSGVGGLIIARAIHKYMPEYEYVYLGDTKRVPYGNRSAEVVYEFTREAVGYLLNKENCAIIVVACNTASALALRKIQKEYLPKNFPDKKVIGVLIPAAEEAAKFARVGVLGTVGTVESKSFPKEIKKINKNTKVFQNAAPMLVPLAEAGENVAALPFIKEYLRPILKANLPERPFGRAGIDALVLGCTHYPIFKKEIKSLLPKNVKIISQDEIIPKKFKNYLARHIEIENTLSKNKNLQKNKEIRILVTEITASTKNLSPKLVQI